MMLYQIIYDLIKWDRPIFGSKYIRWDPVGSHEIRLCMPFFGSAMIWCEIYDHIWLYVPISELFSSGTEYWCLWQPKCLVITKNPRNPLNYFLFLFPDFFKQKNKILNYTGLQPKNTKNATCLDKLIETSWIRKTL